MITPIGLRAWDTAVQKKFQFEVKSIRPTGRSPTAINLLPKSKNPDPVSGTKPDSPDWVQPQSHGVRNQSYSSPPTVPKTKSRQPHTCPKASGPQPTRPPLHKPPYSKRMPHPSYQRKQTGNQRNIPKESSYIRRDNLSIPQKSPGLLFEETYENRPYRTINYRGNTVWRTYPVQPVWVSQTFQGLL